MAEYTMAQAIVILGKALGAGIAILGVVGAGLGQGQAIGRLSEAISRNPEASGTIMSQALIAYGIAESASIYALVVSILIIFVL